MGRTWAQGAWYGAWYLDNRAVEKHGGLVHLAAISCPRRLRLASEACEFRDNARAMAPTCLWCMAVWVLS